MTVRLNPYLSFRDDAAEAMAFYHSVFGGELTTTRFGDLGVGAPDEATKVMHSQITVPGVLTLMGADTPEQMAVSTGHRSIMLSGDEEATLRGWWGALAEGATVDSPLEKAVWGDTFGQLTDRFGVEWLVNIAGAAS